MIFQTFALYPHLSTFDNLAYRCATAGWVATRSVSASARSPDAQHQPHARAQAEHAVRRRQQRLAIGRALVRHLLLLWTSR
jgi:ABC-type sugar transport system ATPase subunit